MACLARRSKAGRRVHAAARADAAVLRRVPLAVFQPKFFPFAAVDTRLARVGRRGPRDEQGAARGGDGCCYEEELHGLHVCATPLIAAAGWCASLALPHGLVHLLMRCVPLQFGAGACRCWMSASRSFASRRGFGASKCNAKSKLASRKTLARKVGYRSQFVSWTSFLEVPAPLTPSMRGGKCLPFSESDPDLSGPDRNSRT